MSNRLTIAVLSAGNSIHTVRWVNAYADKGHQVHLITLHPALPTIDPKISVHQLPYWRGAGYLLNGGAVQRILKRIKPDVVNVHYATGYGTLGRNCKEWPVVMNVWGSDVLLFPDKSWLHERLLKSNLGYPRIVVSTSKVMAAKVKEIVPGVEPVVVPFGVDLGRFAPGSARKPSSEVILGTVKTLEHVYGVDRLVEAFIALTNEKDLPPLRLRIVGDGSQRSRLEARVRAAGIVDRVEFIGAVPHEMVPDQLNKLDIYVALSRSESFGVAVIEASACGLPVVVSDVGGLPEVVVDGVTGRVVNGEDQHLIQQALRELIDHPQERERMGMAGRTFVAQDLGWEACVDRMLHQLDLAQGIHP